ncbi:alpha-1,2-fucosyltransferase [Paraglaciecola sp.]|uniref:alpha-1,2-fucosyltransferase n=1 Tax=Paraglaciecola sp. TaxID=1920173 RepID=UPI00273FA3D7|nr:alpha-1,2-fucosyltransferase [Paraglaciecola sp.]MDP5030883.1 alpha-1,2-fucosyltransferase [Paraglaciecola sp.]
MVTAKLVGGISNQFCIYAAVKSLCINKNYEMDIDLIHYNKLNQRSFGFDNFNIEYRAISGAERFNKFSLVNFSYGGRFGLKITNYINQLVLRKNKNIYKEQDLHFDENFYNIDDETYIDGNFISYKYYSSVLDLLKVEFKPRIISENCSTLAKQIASENSAAFHYRCGDYLSNPIAKNFHGNLGLDYYKQAFDVLNSKCTNLVSYIFTDDLVKAKRHFSFIDNAIFIQEKAKLSDLEELELMKYAKANVIANSGFSRWAALLNYNSDSFTILPKTWFKGYDIDTQEIGPNSWERLPSNFVS